MFSGGMIEDKKFGKKPNFRPFLKLLLKAVLQCEELSSQRRWSGSLRHAGGWKCETCVRGRRGSWLERWGGVECGEGGGVKCLTGDSGQGGGRVPRCRSCWTVELR